MYQTPILLIIFNRPATTQQVFNAIKQVKPKFLFVAADGPRPTMPDDKEKCKQARAIIEQIDWDCDIKILFREKNLGCGCGPAEAITWFFENVEEGIILEDDCLPSNDFFRFAETMLHKYKDNDKIMLVAGTNFLGSWKSKKQAYFFSSFIHTWGWASWQRAWSLYDYELSDWGEKKSLSQFKKNIATRRMYNRLMYIFDYTKANLSSITWWDFQWCYCVLKNGGLCVVPSVNLITNLGIGSDSSHTTNPNNLATPILKTYVLKGNLLDDMPLVAELPFDKKFFKKIFLKKRNLITRSIKFLRRNIKKLFFFNK